MATLKASTAVKQTSEDSLASRLFHGFTAAVTSPEAIKAEKSLAVLIGTRLLIAAGAGAGLIDLLTRAFGG
jgi:hypothetical protein